MKTKVDEIADRIYRLSTFLPAVGPSGFFTSDLFTHVGNPPALTDGDILGPAAAAEKQFGFTALGPATGATIRRLAKLAPRTLAVMHGSSYSGDGAPMLESLAGFYDELLRKGGE